MANQNENKDLTTQRLVSSANAILQKRVVYENGLSDLDRMSRVNSRFSCMFSMLLGASFIAMFLYDWQSRSFDGSATRWDVVEFVLGIAFFHSGALAWHRRRIDLAVRNLIDLQLKKSRDF
jgi:hypothetical protein